MSHAPPCPVIVVIDALLDATQEQLRQGYALHTAVLLGLTRELISTTIAPAELLLDTLMRSLVGAAEDHPELAQALGEIGDLAQSEWHRDAAGCAGLPRCAICAAHGVQPECDDPGLGDDGDADGPW